MRALAIVSVVMAAALAFGPAVRAQSIEWASTPADPAASHSAAVLGQPDGVSASVMYHGFAYVRDFRPGKVTARQIERALKLPANELRKWDLIAFESQPLASAKLFDGSSWMVSDLNQVAATVYDGRLQRPAAGPGGLGWLFRSGALPQAAFRKLFTGSRPTGDAAWLLIKLPAGVDKRSANLAVWLGGGQIAGVDADPAPDAIGAIR